MAQPSPPSPPCTSDYPQHRDCTVQLYEGVRVEGYSFVDGTGTWCNMGNGAQRLTLHAALLDCTLGDFQGRQPPCIGVILQGGQQAETGSS